MLYAWSLNANNLVCDLQYEVGMEEKQLSWLTRDQERDDCR